MKKLLTLILGAALCLGLLFVQVPRTAASAYSPADDLVLLAAGAEWRYQANGGAALDAVTAAGVTDVTALPTADWPAGNAPFGYGSHYRVGTELGYGGDINNRYNAAVLSAEFTLSAEQFREIGEELLFVMADADYDDGFVLFVNGTETDRVQVAAGQPLGSALFAAAGVGSSYATEQLIFQPALFREGVNTLTAVVFQNTKASNDLYFDLRLYANPEPNYPDDYYPKMIAVTFYGDTQTAKGFNWKTDKFFKRSDVEVVVKTSDSPDWTRATRFEGAAQTINGEWIHKAVARDLLPDAEYWYRVGDLSRGVWSDPAVFRTADSDNRFTFFHMSDVQSESTAAYQRWQNVLKTAFDLYPEADFIANTGDFTENGVYLSQWEWMFEIPGDILRNTTLAPVTGNHDVLGPDIFNSRFHTPYPAQIDSVAYGVYYSFDYENAHFTVLNTNDNTRQRPAADSAAAGIAGLNKTQYDWFVEDVSSTDKQWKIVMMHAGLFTSGNKINHDAYIGDMRRQIVPFMVEQGVDIVLQGHDHVYIRTKPQMLGSVDLPETITEIADGRATTYMVDPEGIVYINSNSAGGATLYDLIDYDKTMIYPAKTEQPGTTMFSAIRIEANRLWFDSYLVKQPASEAEQAEAVRYDSFAIVKDLYTEVVGGIEALPAPDELDADDYETIMALQSAYLRLKPADRLKVGNYAALTAAEERVKTVMRAASVPGGSGNVGLIVGLAVSLPLAGSGIAVAAVWIVRRKKRHA